MADNIIDNSESDTNDDLVPTFSKATGIFTFPDGIEFQCQILKASKIKTDRFFTGFSFNNDDEEE
jgi:hypothetical protein